MPEHQDLVACDEIKMTGNIPAERTRELQDHAQHTIHSRRVLSNITLPPPFALRQLDELPQGELWILLQKSKLLFPTIHQIRVPSNYLSNDWR